MEQNNEVVENTTQEPKTFDEILNDKEYQREFDKRIDKALNTAKIKWQEEAEKQKSEAEKLASMKEAERNAYELDKARKAQQEAEAKLNAYELKEQAVIIAKENGVDTGLLELIDFGTIKAENVEPKIKNIKTIFDKAVENAINNKLKEETPKTVAGETKATNNTPKFF